MISLIFFVTAVLFLGIVVSVLLNAAIPLSEGELT